MKTNKILAAALIAAFGFTSCAKDKGENIEKKGNPAEVTINLKAPRESRADEGTEPGTGNEIVVTSLEFFVFNADKSVDTETPYLRKTDGLNAATTLPITAGDGKIFLAGVNSTIFANLAAYESAASADKTYAAILNKIAALELINTNSQTNPGSGGFVMSAEATKNVLAAPAVNTLTMTIERTLSKVERPVVSDDLEIDFTDELGMLKQLWPTVTTTDAIQDLTWEFDGYVVINGIQNSYIFAREFEDWTAPFISPATGASWFKTVYTDDTGAAISAVYGGSGIGDNFIEVDYNEETEIVYVYENSPEEVAAQPGEAISFVKDQVTAFLIKGHFTATVGGTANTESAPRYWRVNLIKDDVWKVYRNSIYRVTLNNVLTPGYGTPEAAENTDPIVDPEETSITIDLNIAPWYIKLQNVDF